MGDMGDIFRAYTQHKKERRDNNLRKAEEDKTINWTVHTPYHWSYTLNGESLNYWPSRNKFQYQGKVMTGDVKSYIKKREKA